MVLFLIFIIHANILFIRSVLEMYQHILSGTVALDSTLQTLAIPIKYIWTHMVSFNNKQSVMLLYARIIMNHRIVKSPNQQESSRLQQKTYPIK